LENIENIVARDRILNASLQLFSIKGYDATSVNDIAKAAHVNKALIYYYFKSKEEILDSMVKSLFNNALSIAMDFIHTNIVQMIKKGYLDILPDRLHFVSEEAIQRFLKNTYAFCERVIDFVIEKRDIIRVLMLESLKKGKHHNAIFRLFNLSRGGDENPIYKTISEADQDYTYSDDMVIFNFFFTIIPVINFAAYYDDFKAASSLSDKELRNSFLQSCRIHIASLVSERDILLKNKNIME